MAITLSFILFLMSEEGPFKSIFTILSFKALAACILSFLYDRLV